MYDKTHCTRKMAKLNSHCLFRKCELPSIQQIKLSKFNLSACTEIIFVMINSQMFVVKAFCIQVAAKLDLWVSGEPWLVWTACPQLEARCFLITRDTGADCAGKSQRGPATRRGQSRGGHPAAVRCSL